MTRSPSIHASRQAAAQTAFDGLGPSPSDHLLLAVQCAQAHHVAALYRTSSGVVYVARPQAHSHGDRDRHDAAHHAHHHGTPWVDWVEPGEGVALEDPLPAGCECGARSLSRALLLQAVADGEHRLVID